MQIPNSGIYIFDSDSDAGGPKPILRNIISYFEETQGTFEANKDIQVLVFFKISLVETLCMDFKR